MSRITMPAWYIDMCVNAPFPVRSPTAVEHHRDAVAVSVDAPGGDPDVHRCALGLQDTPDDRARLRLLHGQQVVGGLHHGHLDAEAEHHLGELTPDRTA